MRSCGAERSKVFSDRALGLNDIAEMSWSESRSISMTTLAPERPTGFYMEQSEAAKEIFDAWLEPLRDLGVRRNVIEGIGSTDHVPFVQQGVPAFTTIKDFRHYDVRTRHTNADFADAVDVEDLRQSAIVLAVVAWHAAMRDDAIPRLPVPRSP